MNRVILSPEYFPSPTIGRPVSGAQIFVGEVDKLPQDFPIQASVQQEDGSIVDVSQPVVCGAGGVPLHNGSPVTILVNGGYSLQVLDKGGSQIYYIPEQLLSTADSEAITYNPPFIDAEPRTQEDKNADIVSVKDFGAIGDGLTNDDTAIAAAVSSTFLSGSSLLWPEGTYPSILNITNFHAVKHVGPGVVLRGSDLFTVEPSDGDTNIIYISATGLASNDGLSSAQPKEGQSGIDALDNYRPVLLGTWKIVGAAGTYDRLRFPDEGLPSQNLIEIVGPDVGGHPNVPTMLIKEGAEESGFGILASQGTRIKVKDIKIEDFNGSTSSSGIRVNSDGEIVTENVHLGDCFYGVTGFENTTIDVKGGIFDDCGFLLSDIGDPDGHAIRGVFHVNFKVGTQNAGTLANGPIIRNCAGVIRAQELSTGHMDFTTIEDCFSGARLLVNSRLNIDGSSFKRITNSAVFATQGCHVDPTSATIFGTGADANGRNISIGFAGTASTLGIDGVNTANAANPAIFKTDNPNITTTGTTVAQVIDTQTIAEECLNDTQFTGISYKKVGLRIFGSMSGSAGAFKRLILRVGTTPTTISFSSAATGNFQAELSVVFQGPSAQFVAAIGYSTASLPINNINIAEATTADLDVAFEVVLDNVADSITIINYEWYEIGF